MRLYSTRHTAPEVSFKEAVLRGLAPDGGLYLPTVVPLIPEREWKRWVMMEPDAIAAALFGTLVGDEFERSTLETLFADALHFDFPLVRIDETTWVLELFHGPTLAFKDVGARTMARIMPLALPEDEKRDICILTATSGDTGAAVAHGFYGVPRTRVYIVYPSGKVSAIQEKQCTTLGGNITAIEVDGTFDDCQRLVKEALQVPELQKKFVLTSANSINISRLLPQMVYYIHALGSCARQLASSSAASHSAARPHFVVPSGNFGNVCAGLLAAKMGMPAGRFFVSSNRNDVVPQFLRGMPYKPRPSVSTWSNAMDVGDPSNFSRILELNGGESGVRKHLAGRSVSDEDTLKTIAEVWDSCGYLADPHTATGLSALKQMRDEGEAGGHAIVLATAHPAKFTTVMDQVVPGSTILPESLRMLQTKQKTSIRIEADIRGLLSCITA